MLLHSLLLYAHLTTLDVVVTSADSSIVALLVSNNFSEIKSAVFKKNSVDNLFDVACSDVCERFKLLLFLMLLALLAWAQNPTGKLQPALWFVFFLVMATEYAADWFEEAQQRHHTTDPSLGNTIFRLGGRF